MTPLVPLVATTTGLLVVATGVITASFVTEYVSTRDPRPEKTRPHCTDDPGWLFALLAEEDDWPAWYPGAGVDHLYPDCPAYQRAPHRRDLKGDAIPGVGRPDGDRICGHCRRRADKEDLVDVA